MLFLLKAVAFQVIFLIAMVLTQRSKGQKEGRKQRHQISTRTCLLSRDKPLISLKNLYLLWAKVSKR